MPLSSFPLFKDLAPEHLAVLQAGGTVLEPRDGTPVFEQGEKADAVYAVIGGDGHIRIGAVDKNSKALMVEMFQVGEIFGEMAVIDDGVRSASAIAEGRVRLFKIRAASFQAAMAQSPAMGLAMSRWFTQRLRRTFALLQDATFETLEVRLARQVLYLVDREGKQTPQGYRLAARLRQGDLADLLGATTRSIITILNAWRSAGLVTYDTDQARLTVRNVDALRALVKAE